MKAINCASACILIVFDICGAFFQRFSGQYLCLENSQFFLKIVRPLPYKVIVNDDYIRLGQTFSLTADL